MLDNLETYDEIAVTTYGQNAKKRISSEYTWNKVVCDYENLFLANV